MRILRELRIRNLALIDDAELSFEPGLTVLTGETGAGKSILVGAIGLLLGERASSEQIRSGTAEADVSGVIELDTVAGQVAGLFSEHGIPAADGTLIIRRRLARSGRNSVYLNQVPVPLTTLTAVGDRLIDLHGQHEHQSLLSTESHRAIIDGLPAVLSPAARYAESWTAYAASKAELENHERRAGELRERRDIMEFQLKELAALSLQRNEEEKLESELALVSSSTQRQECIAAIAGLLGEGRASVPGQINAIVRHLNTLSRYDAAVQSWLTDIEGARSVFSELETFCSSYLETLADRADPGRVDAINERLAKIQRLKKKYRCDGNALIDKQEQFGADLAAIENIDADREQLEKACTRALEACMSAGKALGRSRRDAARAFDRQITAQMEKLGFDHGRWRTDFTELSAPGPNGLEECAFMVCTNPGEPFLPLARTASGGEISRLMLAVKTVLAGHDDIPILIFDEIDTGIGGVLAGEVAEALVELSTTHQVFCITHLHQIASRADHHFSVYKETEAGRTVTRVRPLTDEARVAEIARMLGGESDITRKHARELLKKK